jgi:small subunit ribosomal protein S11
MKSYNVHAYVSYGNTLLTITSDDGKTLKTISAGTVGFNKARRSSPFAALQVAQKAGAWIQDDSKDSDTPEIHVFFKGLGQNRASVLKGFHASQCALKDIYETTLKPHNGCRPPKRRRV